MTEEQVKLTQAQLSLEKETGQTFQFTSVSETISKCLLLGLTSKANRLKSDFKVPDKRFLWIHLKVLVQTQNWDDLDKFIKSNPKFGIVSVVDTIIKNGHHNQALKYAEAALRSVTSLTEKAALEDMVSRLKAFLSGH
jgi:hypothetical protein